MPVADLIRQVGIFGTDVLPLEEAGTWGCSPDQVRELKQLQEENGRLKKLVAELSLGGDFSSLNAVIPAPEMVKLRA